MRVFLSLSGVPSFFGIRGEQSPYAFASAVGFCLGGASALICGSGLAILQMIVPKELWGASAAASLEMLGTGELFLVAILLVPFLETFIGQLMPLELARGIGLRRSQCIFVGAFVFGLGHHLNGGLVHGISTFVAGGFFSCAYMAVRPYGYLPSYLSSYTAHMTHNFLVMFVLPVLIPNLE